MHYFVSFSLSFSPSIPINPQNPHEPPNAQRRRHVFENQHVPEDLTGLDEDDKDLMLLSSHKEQQKAEYIHILYIQRFRYRDRKRPVA